MAVVICEKPSQAQNIRAAIGNRYGDVLAAQGHLLRFEMPEEIKPEWNIWGFDVLAKPDGTRFDYAPSEGGGKAEALKRIRDALQTTDHVIIATDCDREGEGIGRELLLYLGFEGKVSRAMFSAEDETTLRTAFDTLKPASAYDNLYEAFYARAASDQITNLTLTRAATKALIPAGVRFVLGIGRVKTPTLGIVCARELEIRNFEPRDFFEIAMDVEGQAGSARLWHRPSGAERVFDAQRAAAIRDRAAMWSGPVAVTRETKKQPPPKLFDLPALQKRASAWGWTAAKTLEIAQNLYETHKITTYPRAETKYLPESMTSDAPRLLEALRSLPAFDKVPEFEPKTRSAHFSDKGLRGAAHHAVVPNINMAHAFAEIAPNLSADEAKLFDVIARAYVAALAPDHLYDEAVVSALVDVNGQDVLFRQTGRITREPGWKAIYQDDDEKDGENDAEPTLSPLTDGEAVTATDAVCSKKTTTPPKRYTEGSLIDAMQNAHRFIDDEAERDRLKEAKGIGTPATRDGVIEGLKRQKMIETAGKSLAPTESGLKLYAKLLDVAPSLVDPGETAKMEFRLDQIQTGEADADQVVRDAIAEVGSLVDRLRKAEPIAIKAKPTKKMVAFAMKLAAEKSVPLPEGYADHMSVCAAFIDEHHEKKEDGSPSEKQLAYAKTISETTGVDLPGEFSGSAKALSEWIDANQKKMPKRLASESQMKWIKKLVDEDGKRKPKGYPDQVTMADAKKFLDKNFGKKNTRTARPASPPAKRK